MPIHFSIISCTRNSERYLTKSIKSVLAQDYPYVEHIFVDGGSTDGTLERIASLTKDSVVLRDVRGGISNAMNAGIEISKGDVVAHLHSDDYYAHPRVLTHVAEAFERAGVEWLFGRCLSDIDGEVTPENYLVPRYSYRRLLKGNFIPHPATFVRKRLFTEVGWFDEKIRYAMDYDMWLRLGRLADPAQLDEHLSVFRHHSGSSSTSNRMASFHDDFAVRMKYASRAPWSLVYHWTNYFVRRQRLRRAVELAS